MADGKVYTSEQAVKDLEKIIAQETSGVAGAIPEQDDNDLARAFVQIINSEARHEPGFFRRLSDIK
jgi:hypothetical protein